MSTTKPIKLLYVCDFSSPHSRTYIDYFARNSERYSVYVISTRLAQGMPSVQLFELHSEDKVRQTVSKGVLGTVAQRALQRIPSLYVALKNRNMICYVQAHQAEVIGWYEQIRPDLVHAFRTQPEALLAGGIKQAYPATPFVVTTWGQDFVLFSKASQEMARLCRATIGCVDVLLPDNERDARIAKSEFGLPSSAACVVMPATGGLHIEALQEHLSAGTADISVEGNPTLLSMRGYENYYIKVKVLIEALAIYVRTHPQAHLYIDVSKKEQDPVRDNMIYNWVRQAGLGQHITLLHLNRPQVFSYMQACDLYVSATESDGLPMSLLEGLYFGQVPVVFDHESTRKLLQECAGAVTFKSIEPQAIAAAWEAALPIIGQRNRRRQDNQQLIANKYERTANLQQVETIYAQQCGH